jgi:predicted protein tyrosine phosphatase
MSIPTIITTTTSSSSSSTPPSSSSSTTKTPPPTTTTMGRKKSSFHEDMLDALSEISLAKTGRFTTSLSSIGTNTFKWSEIFNNYAKEEEEEDFNKIIFENEASLIIDRLYVGSFKSVLNVQELKKRNIQWILTCAGSLVDTQNPGTTLLNDVIRDHGALIIDDVSEEDILSSTQPALNWIDDALLSDQYSSILVHCAQGKSRSVSVIVLFLVTRMKMTVDEALTHVQTHRQGAEPNPGFMEQLRALQDSNGDFNKAIELHSIRRSGSV